MQPYSLIQVPLLLVSVSVLQIMAKTMHYQAQPPLQEAEAAGLTEAEI